MCFLVDTMLQKTAKNYYILKTNVRQYICSSYYFTVPKYERRYKLTKRQMDILENWKIAEAKIDETIALLNAA